MTRCTVGFVALCTFLSILCLRAPARKSNEPRPGEERSWDIGRGVELVMCYIPTGECQLGSPKSERDLVQKQNVARKQIAIPFWLLIEDEDVRNKYISNGFWLGKYEVTQEQYKLIMGENPSFYDGMQDNEAKGMNTRMFPVEQVSWIDSQDFLAKLNEINGRKEIFNTSKSFTLPHEDQWEYAYRGGRGNQQPYYWGNTLSGDFANHDGNVPFGTDKIGEYLRRTTQVGSYAKKAPHPWGLADMSGNVYEWCDNWFDERNRSMRGGAWTSRAVGCRGAIRDRTWPERRDIETGFRVCLPME